MRVASKFRTIFALVILGGCTAVTGALASTATTHAASNPAGTYIVSNNTFYTYVQASENLDVSFIKLTNTGNNTDSTVTISRPNAADVTCTLDGTTAVGNPASECILNDMTATASGIWRIHFAGGGSGHDHYVWQIVAQNGAVSIPGRTWTNTYALEQTAPHAGINTWYQSEYGYLYNATYNDYDGIDSSLAADGLGLVQPGTCLPHYKSINMGAGFQNYLPPAQCHSAYKLFFEAPASDLPTSSTTWDSGTDWVRPAITTPAISNITFASASTGSRNGNLNFTLSDYRGPLDIHVDTNNNGNFTDPVDTVIPYTAAAEGAQTVAFNGNDGNGNSIPANQAINFRIRVSRVAEIHFIGGDIERRAGGIEIQRLNGPASGATTIYWDDTDFAFPDANRCPVPLGTVAPDGTAGVDSTGGVHAWTTTGCAGGSPQFGGNANNGINGSWGDFRLINDWAFVPTDVSATFTLVGAPSADTLAPTGDNRTIIVMASMAILLAGAALVTTRYALKN